MPLHVKQAGNGKPLVLIHGLFGSLENLGSIARQLAERFCVYSLDLPNHGRSPHTDDTSLAHMAGVVSQWLHQQHFSQASFIGHSMGGKVAMELALTEPDLVDRLAVLDIAPVYYSPHHNRVFEGLLSLQPDALASRAEADAYLSLHVQEPAVRSFLLKNLVKQEQGYGWRMNLATLHNSYERLVGANRSDTVFQGRTLFLKGANSNYIKPEYREEIRRRFPSSLVQVVAGTGHWLHAEKPDRVAQLLLEFLS